MFRHFRAAHDGLMHQYSQLLICRQKLQETALGCPSEDTAVLEHAHCCKVYTQLLLAFVRPAQGRLASLLGNECAAGLAYSLLYDVCRHFAYYIRKINMDLSATEQEKIFVEDMKDVVAQIIERSEFRSPTKESHLSNSKLFTPCIKKNYHCGLENILELAEKKFALEKKEKVTEMIYNNGKIFNRCQFHPTTGIISTVLGGIEQRTEDTGFISHALADALKLMAGTPLQTPEDSMPDSLEQYINKFAADIFAVIDKLETQLLNDHEPLLLQLCLPTLCFVAARSDNDTLSQESRDASCFSPRFSLDFDQVLALVTVGKEHSVSSDHQRRLARFDTKGYYEELNSATVFPELAQHPCDLTLVESSAFENNFKLQKLLPDYLDSLILKFILQITASCKNMQDSVSNKLLLQDGCLPFCTDTLEKCVSRLRRSHRARSSDGACKGQRVAYVCVVKYWLLCFCPRIATHPSRQLYEAFFSYFKLLETMSKLPRQSELKTSVMPPSVFLIEALVKSFLFVLVHGTEPGSSFYQPVLEVYCSNNFQTVLELVMPHVSADAVPVVAAMLQQIIQNIKKERSAALLKSSFSNCSVHHIGKEYSTLFAAPSDPCVCRVACFVSALLCLFSCSCDEASIVCLSSLTQAGLCCCMDAKFIFCRLQENFEQKGPKVVKATYDFVRNVVLDNLNGLRSPKRNECAECGFEDLVVLKDDCNVGEGCVALLLTGPKYQKTVEISSSTNIARYLSNLSQGSSRKLKYADIKWQEFSQYGNFQIENYDPTFHAHVLDVMQSARPEVQQHLLRAMYEPLLEKIFTKNFCTVDNLNEESKVAVLTSVFTAVTVATLQGAREGLAMTRWQWRAWLDIMDGSRRTDNLALLKACYGFACADVFLKAGIRRQPFSPYPDYNFEGSNSFKYIENFALDAQKKFIKLMTKETPDPGLALQLERLQFVWSTFADMGCLYNLPEDYFHKRFWQSSSGHYTLEPLKTLKLLLTALMSQDSWVHGLLRERMQESCCVVQSLLKFIAACPPLAEHKREALEVLQAAFNQCQTAALHILVYEPFLSALLNVNYNVVCSNALLHCACQGSVQVTSWCGCGALLGTADTCRSTPRHPPWPELTLFVLQLLSQHQQTAKSVPNTPTAPHPEATSYSEVAMSCLEPLMDSTASAVMGASSGAATANVSTLDESEGDQSKGSFAEGGDTHTALVERCLEKVLLVCERSEEVRAVLHQAGAMDLIMNGFGEVLRDPADQEGLSLLLLRLWALFARVSVTAAQLRDYLRIFMGAAPPVGALLCTLQAVLESSISLPQFFVEFQSVLPTSSPLYAKYQVYDVLCKLKKTEVARDGFVVEYLRRSGSSLLSDHRQFGEWRAEQLYQKCWLSPVSQCRLACVFPKTVRHSWVPVVNNTAVSFWFKLNLEKRLDDSTHPGQFNPDKFKETRNSRLHVFTVGVKKLMLSAYICTKTGALQLCFSRQVNEAVPWEALSMCSVDWRKALDGRWHHATVAMSSINTKQRADFEIHCSLDCRLNSTKAGIKAIGSVEEKDCCPFVLLGHSVKAAAGDGSASLPQDSIAMTCFSVFDVPELKLLTLLLMFSLGKDLVNYRAVPREPCDQLLKGLLTHDVWMEIKKKYTDGVIADCLRSKLENALLDVNKRLLFHFSPRQSQEFLVYDKYVESSCDVVNQYSGVRRCSCLLFGGPLPVMQTQHLHHALLQLGGARLLLCLLGRVVELSCSISALPVEAEPQHATANCPRCPSRVMQGQAGGAGVPSLTVTHGSEQAQCISLVYWCVQQYPALCRQFHSMDGTAMIMRLLYSNKMDTRMEVLKALLDQCFSEPVVSLDQSCSGVPTTPGAGYLRPPSSNVLVTDPKLLSAVLDHWYRVEVRDVEMKMSGVESMEGRTSAYREECIKKCRQPVILVPRDGNHSVDVLHRAVALVASAPTERHAFNFLQLNAAQAFQKLLNIAQVLQVQEHPQLQVSPSVLLDLLQAMMPSQDCPYVPHWPQSAVAQLVHLLVLCVPPHRSLAWHSGSCSARLVDLYRPYCAAHAKPITWEKRMRDIFETELAEEVTEEVMSLAPLSPTVAAAESLGTLTSQDYDLLEKQTMAGLHERLSCDDAEEDAAPSQGTSAKVALQDALARAIDDEPSVAAVVVPSVAPKPAVKDAASAVAGSSTAAAALPQGAFTVPPIPANTFHLDATSANHIEPVQSPSGRKSNNNVTKQPADAPKAVSSNGDPQGSLNCEIDCLDYKSASASTSPRSSPLDSPSSKNSHEDFAIKEEPSVSDHLAMALYQFLRKQTRADFTSYVKHCLQPDKLSLLTCHPSLAVRCAVMKIFKEILCRYPSPGVEVYKEQLCIIQHQLTCESTYSDELLESCFDLVLSKPDATITPEPTFKLITSNLTKELLEPAVQEHVFITIPPLLAVLPHSDKKSEALFRSILDFLDEVVNLSPLNNSKLLKVPNLGESLLLQFGNCQSINKNFKEVPIANTLTNLTRVLLLHSDEHASIGFDLICKFFLLCENNSTSGSFHATCLRALGRMMHNGLVCLLEALQAVSTCAMTEWLKKKKVPPAYAERVTLDERQRRDAFIPKHPLEEYSRDLLAVPSTLTAILADVKALTPKSTCYLLRIIRLLKIAMNVVFKSDWTRHRDDSSSGSAAGQFPAVLLDLQIEMIKSCGACTADTPRPGYTSLPGIPPHQFDLLSRNFEPELRRSLPETVLLMARPGAAGCFRLHLLRHLKEESCTALLLGYCRDHAPQAFEQLGPLLVQQHTSLFSHPQYADSARVLTAYQQMSHKSLARALSEQDESDVTAAVRNFLDQRTQLAAMELKVDVEACHAKSIREHDSHKKKITDLCNRYIILHGQLKRSVLVGIKAKEEAISKLTSSWLELAADLSIESSPFFRKTPMWWELTQNEAEGNTRKIVSQKAVRVAPIHFVEPDVVRLPTAAEEKLPFHSILSDNSVSPLGEHENIFPRLPDGESDCPQVPLTLKCWVIKPGIEFWGTIFVVFKLGIYFKGTKTVYGYNKETDETFESSFHVKVEQIREIRKLRYRLDEVAFEVSLQDHSSWMFVCDSEGDRKTVVDRLYLETGLPPPLPLKDLLAAATAAWQANHTSNFDYLMQLNRLAGRTYDDLSQYPVFPYVLADYSSKTLDLNNPSVYRDLSKPLPAQTADREREFRQKYEANRVQTQEQQLFTDNEAVGYHYANLYSNSTIVQNYLVRLPPFTLYFLHFQGGRFDQPSRTFRSIKRAYDLVTKDTWADFKEAIPEMYYLPEMFLNTENFDFDHGHETTVCHVELPPWCEGDSRKFVLYHRAALESKDVTQHLPLWIDLIFGHKQTGKKSVDAVNVYHPSAYVEHKHKAANPRLWANMTTMYGQVPRQLFTAPHPSAEKEPPQLEFVEFLRNFSPAPTLSGLEWRCFAFFSFANDLLDTRPVSEELPLLDRGKELLQSGGPGGRFMAAPAGALLISDPSGAVHMLHAGTGDGVIRAWLPPSHAICYTVCDLPSFTQVTASAADGDQVWLGTSCGLVMRCVFGFTPLTTEPLTIKKRNKKAVKAPLPCYSVRCESCRSLHGHDVPVTALALCLPVSVCVTGDQRGDCCVYDVHACVLLRRVSVFNTAVAHVLVMRTSGDWLAATHGSHNKEPRLRLYSVNGVPCGDASLPSPARCLAATSLSEGRAVNVVAVVTDSEITLFSSWDLKRLVTADCCEFPIQSLLWSYDSQQMAVTWANYRYHVWQARAAINTHAAEVVELVTPLHLKAGAWR